MLKDELMKELAEHMELSVELVTAVISFQGEDAAKAAHLHNEIEFSGFGKFLLSRPRTTRKIERMEVKLAEGRVKEEDKEKFIQHIQDLKNRL